MADFSALEAPVHVIDALPVRLPSSKLIGRDLTLARVYQLLRREVKPVLLYGAQGVGKTAIAATLASAFIELPGGVIWLMVDAQTTFADLLAQIGRAYNIDALANSETPLASVGAAFAELTQHKPLVILDGATDSAVVSEFILRAAERTPILVVSDAVTEPQGPWAAIRIVRFDPEISTQMFNAYAGTMHPRETLELLTEALEHTPFALAIAAGAVKSGAISLEKLPALLPNRPGITAPLKALTAAFTTLSKELQGLLLLLGATYQGAASADLLGRVGNIPKDIIDRAMQPLIDRYLVERTSRAGQVYFRLHPITFAFTEAWLRGTSRLNDLRGKVGTALIAYVDQYRQDRDADRLIAEMMHIRAAVQQARAAGDDAFADRLTAALLDTGDFARSRGFLYDLLVMRGRPAVAATPFPLHDAPLTQQLLPIDEPAPPVKAIEPDEPSDDDDEALDLLDDFDLQETSSIDDVIELEEFEGKPVVILPDDDEEDALDEEDFQIASLLRTDIDEEDDDEDADELLDLLKDDIDESSDISVVPILDDEPLDEVAQLRADVRRVRADGDDRRLLPLLLELGTSLANDGDAETETINVYSEALTVAEGLDDNAQSILILEQLARLTFRTENYAASVLHASRAVTLTRRMGDERAERRLLTLLGDAHEQAGESADAERAFSDALDLARTAGDKGDEAILLYKVGLAQLDAGKPQAAIDTWEDALIRFRDLERRDYEGRVLGGLGTASVELERWNEAIRFHTSALHIAREFANRDEEQMHLTNLAYAHVRAKQLGEAVKRYRQALHLAYTRDKRDEIVSTTVDIARLLVESRRHLDITELLVDAALVYDPTDRDLKRLKERIQDERPHLPPDIVQASVGGTAQEYAAFAYAMLDD